MVDCYRDVTDRNRNKLSNDYQLLESKLFALEPFMEQQQISELTHLILKYNNLCWFTLNSARGETIDIPTFAQNYEILNKEIRKILFTTLFEDKP